MSSARLPLGIALALWALSFATAHADDPNDVYWDNRMSPAVGGVNGWITATTVYHGQVIAAGLFTLAGETPANNIAAWDGSSWSALSSGITGSVSALIVYDDKLIAAGQLSVAGGVSVDKIAAWDGSSWSPLGSGIQSWGVNALAVFDGKLIVAGYFTQAGGVEAQNIAAWDGSSWSPLAAGMNYSVNALSVFQDKLVAGGVFTSAGGQPAKRIAAWDGQSWSALGDGVASELTRLTVYNDRLVVSCGWYPSDSHVYSWDGANWSVLIDSVIVTAMSAYQGQLVLGGSLTSLGGETAPALAVWDGTVWHTLGEDRGHFWALSLTVWEQQLIVGGVGSLAADEAPTTGIAAWDGTSWSHLGPPSVGLNGGVSDLALYRDELIVSGSFFSAGGATAEGLATWNGLHWSSTDKPIGPVRSMAVFRDKLYAAQTGVSYGWSYFIGPAALSAWDGNVWSEPDSTIFGSIGDLTVYHDQLIVPSTQYSGVECAIPDVSLFASNGTDWSTPLALGSINLQSVIVFGDQLMLGGATYCCSDCPGIHDVLDGWDGEELREISSALDGGILCMTEYNHQLVVGGSFNTHVAAWDGSTWSPFGAGTDGSVRALAVHDGKLIAGGSFTAAGGVPASNIAMWDGQSWSPLGSGTNGRVTHLIEYAGDLVVAGDFTTSGGKTSPYLALWTKHEVNQVAVDIVPGSCNNLINYNEHAAQARAVVSVAIMGSANLDVHDVDAAGISLHGASPARWRYEDVGTSADKSGDSCACSEAGPDGYADLTLKFYRSDLLAALSDGSSARRSAFDHGVIHVSGEFKDGSPFEGYDCVTLVGGHGAAAAADAAPRRFELLANVPNPFNASTRIAFYLPEAAHVRLVVYNVLGRKVETLIDRTLDAGEQSVTWDASRVSSGVYYYRLEAGAHVATRQMMLVK